MSAGHTIVYLMIGAYALLGHELVESVEPSLVHPLWREARRMDLEIGGHQRPQIDGRGARQGGGTGLDELERAVHQERPHQR